MSVHHSTTRRRFLGMLPGSIAAAVGSDSLVERQAEASGYGKTQKSLAESLPVGYAPSLEQRAAFRQAGVMLADWMHRTCNYVPSDPRIPSEAETLQTFRAAKKLLEPLAEQVSRLCAAYTAELDCIADETDREDARKLISEYLACELARRGGVNLEEFDGHSSIDWYLGHRV